MADDFKLTPEMMQLLREEGSKNQIHMSRYGACLCNKLLDVLQYEKAYHSGRFYQGKQIAPGINYRAILCEECETTHKEHPRVVCLGCRRLMGFCAPGREATGFVFEKNRHYHILDCPRCNPKRPCTPVLEHEKFCRDRGIKTDTDKDLLQEIETKILQAEREAATLRAEFQASKRK